MATNDENETAASSGTGAPNTGSPESIPPTPPQPESTGPHPAGAVAGGTPLQTVGTAAPRPRGLFERTWVRVTGAAVAAVILLGGGIGIGTAVSHESTDDTSAVNDDDGPPTGRGDDHRDAADERGPAQGDRHGQRDDDGDGSGDSPDSTPAPAPSTSP